MFTENDIIYSYSRKQAIEDGVLVDLNQFIPVKESGFKYPIACTSAVYSLIERAVENTRYCNDYKGIVWDIFNMLRFAIRRNHDTIIKFTVIITGTGNKKYHELKSICSPGDQGEPVITIMFPDED